MIPLLLLAAVAASSQVANDSPPGWTPDTLLSLNDVQESREPSLAIDGPGRLHVVWKDNRRLGGYDEIHYRCRDSTGWSELFSVGHLDTVHNTPDIAVGEDNSAHVCFMRRHTGPFTFFDVGYRRRDGPSGSWDAEERLTFEDSLGYSGRPQAAVIGDSVFVFWLQERLVPPEIVYRSNNGAGWTEPRNVTGDDAVPSGYYDILATRDGWLHVVWQDLRGDTQQVLHRFHNGDSWSVPERVTFHGYACIQPDMDSDSAGDIHLVYTGGGPEDRIHHRIRDRSSGTWGPATHFYSWAGAPRPMIGVNRITGERHLTHVGNQGIWTLAYRRYDPGSGQWTDSVMLTRFNVATGPGKPVLDSDGYVHLAFWDQRFGAQEEVFYKSNRAATGFSESWPGPVAARCPVYPSLTSGVVHLRAARGAMLVDASGRLAARLQPGRNDVSRLAPGVYFVRSMDEGGRSSLGKVLVGR